VTREKDRDRGEQLQLELPIEILDTVSGPFERRQVSSGRVAPVAPVATRRRRSPSVAKR
jgi:hypothetical protein